MEALGFIAIAFIHIWTLLSVLANVVERTLVQTTNIWSLLAMEDLDSATLPVPQKENALPKLRSSLSITPMMRMMMTMTMINFNPPKTL